MLAEIGAPVELVAAEGDRDDERDAGGDVVLGLAQVAHPGDVGVAADQRRGVGGVEGPVAGAVVAVVVDHLGGVVDGRVDVAGGDAARRRGDAVVGEHHRRRRRRAPRLAAAAPLGVVAAVHHLGVRRHRQHGADAGAGRARSAAGLRASAEATAPTRSRLTARLEPRGRSRVTRTCHDVIEPVAYHVSTLTRPRSSAWPEYVVRGTGRLRRDQSAMVSQVPVVPSAARRADLDADQAPARGGGLPRGDQGGRGEAGVAHGEVQVPAS